MRMLDNVIDINYYAVDKRATPTCATARSAWVMAFPGRLRAAAFRTSSEAAVEFMTMDTICYHAHWASSNWAQSAAAIPATRFAVAAASLPLTPWRCWNKGAAATCRSNRSQPRDWHALREQIARDGMRNSNCVAIAPTATISNIVGVDAH